MIPHLNANVPSRVLPLAIPLMVVLISSSLTAPAQTVDPLAPAVESARRKRDPVQLESLKSQLEQHINQDTNDSQALFKLALVEGYLVDVAELRKDKKAANAALDKAIEAAQHSIKLNDKSADAHRQPVRFAVEREIRSDQSALARRL
jgi:hypothetical protein